MAKICIEECGIDANIAAKEGDWQYMAPISIFHTHAFGCPYIQTYTIGPTSLPILNITGIPYPLNPDEVAQGLQLVEYLLTKGAFVNGLQMPNGTYPFHPLREIVAEPDYVGHEVADFNLLYNWREEGRSDQTKAIDLTRMHKQYLYKALVIPAFMRFFESGLAADMDFNFSRQFSNRARLRLPHEGSFNFVWHMDPEAGGVFAPAMSMLKHVITMREYDPNTLYSRPEMQEAILSKGRFEL